MKNLVLSYIYEKLKVNYEEFSSYFPDYSEGDALYIPPKKFFWDIFATFDYELAEKYISYSLEQRSEALKPEYSHIEVNEEMKEELEKVNYHSKKKGKALTLLATGRALTGVKRKHKKRYNVYEGYKSRRPKPHNNMSITDYVRMEKLPPALRKVSHSKGNATQSQDVVDME